MLLSYPLGRHSFIVPEQTAEPFAANDFPFNDYGGRRLDQFVPDSLMASLGVVVLEVFEDRASHSCLSKPDHSAQAFLLDRTHKPLRMRVGIGCLDWSLHDLQSRGQRLPEASTELGVAIAEEEALALSLPKTSCVQSSTVLFDLTVLAPGLILGSGCTFSSSS